MSKIGKKPIALPSGVTVTVDGSLVTVKWSKGTLSYSLLHGVTVSLEETTVTVAIDTDEKKNLWGLTRTLIQNMVTGVSEWYTIKLHILWVWFGAKIAGQKVNLALWFSHPVEYVLPAGIAATIEKDTKGNDIITLTWIDKQLIWETAAKIRKLKAPEPYKGKGIRYIDETIKLKAGKAAKK
jgi:large subunit ribosomal protein L6